MRRIIFMIIALTIALAVSAKTKVKVACVGNSVTYGYGLADRDHESYPVRLQQLLGNGYDVRNFGHSGATLLRRAFRPYMRQSVFQQAIDFKADLVVIHLGLNDTDPRAWPEYGGEFVADYYALIDSMLAANPKARVWVCLTTPIFHRHPRFQSGTRDWQAEVQKAIRCVARGRNLPLIDLYEPFHSRPDLFPDALHPNAEGAELLAKTVYSALTGDYGGLHTSVLYGDGMILQRGSTTTLRGMANAGETVDITLTDARRQQVARMQTTAGADGRWKATMKREAGGPYTLSLKAKSGQLTYHDVWFGDVWMCSGQSNMEMTVSETITAQEDLASAEVAESRRPQAPLRIFNFRAKYPTSAITWTKAQCDTVNRLQYLQNWGWQRPSAESISHFSSIGYHFGRMLADSLQVPIGIVCNAVGGTTTESWVSREVMEWQLPNILTNWYDGDYGQAWARTRALQNVREGIEALGRWGTDLQRHPYDPCYMYESAIVPLDHYNIKGVCWYQGESNAHNLQLHGTLYRLMHNSLSRYFNDSHLPFYMVQLSSLNRDSWPAFRNSQRLLSRRLMDHLIVTSDLGDETNVHYGNKRVVGYRMALKALHDTYRHEVEGTGPSVLRAVDEGENIRITFHHGKGLHTQTPAVTPYREVGPSPITFEVCGEDYIYHEVPARIEGEAVILDVRSIDRPRSVRYGWQPFTRANLYNGAGLPASTFQIDLRKDE